MKNWIYHIGKMILGCLLLIGCSEEEWLKQSIVGEDKVSVALDFGSISHNKVEIKTRSTYELHYESMVRNLYVMIFANDERIYARYFDNENLNKTNEDEYWTVTNMTSTSNTQTHGTLHLKVPTVQNAEIVMIANIDLDFMNLSKERLGLICTKEELQKMLVSLNQEMPARNAGYFMMIGSKEGVGISETGNITVPGGKVLLDRIDAKVEVNVRIDPNEKSSRQQVKEFTPESWQVVNLPNTCYLLPNTDELYLDDASYFHLEPKNFETTEKEKNANNAETGATLHGFSFYTLENMCSGQKKKSTGGNFHNREKRKKHDSDPTAENYGTYDTSDGLWEYAPEKSTYIIIKGELKMVVDPGLTTEQHLVADVTYNVHLGDFVQDKDNYDVCRNTHYNYTINIKGVDKIEVEVETSNDNLPGVTEEQPGAMGHLYEAEEDIYTFDAHYGQRVYTIKASEVDIENMTWYVRTPFGREGIPMKNELGQEIYNDLDYGWVEFMLNNKDDGTNVYSDANQKYPKDKNGLMSVIEVLNLIKAETTKWKTGSPSAFDANDEIKFTVFVDEFYYNENPMNPNDPDILWKKFVNQPNRLMHILCKNQRSKDGDSSITGSILTIRQRSIQTPFNLDMGKTDLNEAWGAETEDEMNNQAWFYSPDERRTSGSSFKPSIAADNTSRTDGLYNTACLLNLVSGTGQNKTLNKNLHWDTFLDFSGPEVELEGKYKAGLYSTLLRNRDLDGDGIIDPEELRWYIGSLDQLCGLFLGDQGLSPDAQLYPISTSLEPNSPVASGPFAGVYPWRLHVVSSTSSYAGNVPTIVWAEEGASTGDYQVHYDKPAYSPIRCVRNLGMEPATAENILRAGNNYPEDNLVKVIAPTGTMNTSSVYRFDMSNMNAKSLREHFTSREPIPRNEYSGESRLYYGFETGPLYNLGKTYQANDGLKSMLENGESPSLNSESYNGYRVANVREGVVMYLYCQGNWWDSSNSGFLVSNYYSFGYYGNQYDGTNFYSWGVFKDRITVGAQGTTQIRFVKDWKP